MESGLILTLLVLAIGFYMAWNIGANDVSNAMGTSVGSGALTIRQAVILAAIFEFCGAVFVGSNVAETMQRGLIDTSLFISDPIILILGMCGALLGTGIWLQVASFFGWPVSTTHAIVGAIVGFGALVGGADAIKWGEIGSIAISWVLSPLLSGTISYLIFSMLQKKILYAMSPIDATKRYMPLLMAIVFGTFTLSFITHGLENLKVYFSFPESLGIALIVAAVAALVTFFVLKRWKFEKTSCPIAHPPRSIISVEKAIKHLQRARVNSFNETHERLCSLLSEVEQLSAKMRQESSVPDRVSDYRVVEKMFISLQLLSACYVAFAHGANDVANAIGPVAAVLDMIKKGAISETAPVPLWLLALGGFGIVLGLATWGWRVIVTIGKKITELTPTRGFCAEFGAATTILAASKLGLPISTTHCLVGSVLGVGMAKGIHAINLTMLRDIVLSWIITLPASALMSILVFYALKAIFIS